MYLNMWMNKPVFGTKIQIMKNLIITIILFVSFSCNPTSKTSEKQENKSDKDLSMIIVGDSLIVLTDKETGVELYRKGNYPGKILYRYPYYPKEKINDFQFNSSGIALKTDFNRIIYIKFSDKTQISPIDTILKYYADDKKLFNDMKFELFIDSIDIKLSYLSNRNVNKYIQKKVSLR